MLIAVCLAFLIAMLTGCSSSTTPRTPDETYDHSIRDVDFLRSQYFLPSDPDRAIPRIDYASIRVFLDDFDPINNRELGAMETRAYIDPRTAGDPTLPGNTPFYAGVFHQLQEELDWRLMGTTRIPIPVIVLKSRLSSTHTLGLAYRETLFVAGEGDRIVDVGTSQDEFLAPGDTLVVKMLRPRESEWGTQNLPESIWAPVQRLELKNVYSLGTRNINPDQFLLRIVRDDDVTPRSFGVNYLGEAIPYIQILGLDQVDHATQAREPDGLVDVEYIDYGEGLLFFPDLRPFDPSLADIAGGRHQVGDPIGSLYRARSWPTTLTQDPDQLHRPDTLGWELGPHLWAVPSPDREQEIVSEIYDLRNDRLVSQSSILTRYSIHIANPYP